MTVAPAGDHELRVELFAPAAYALFAHLAVPDAGARFSDNYFDLEPGERRVVTITSREAALEPDQVTLGWWSPRGE